MDVRIAPESLTVSALAWCPEVVEMDGHCIAGGFIRAYFAGEKPSDMDIYFTGEDKFAAARELLKENEWTEVSATDRAATMIKDKKAVQLINFLYGVGEEIIAEFDFTICAAAMTLQQTDDGVKGLLSMHNNFFEHLAGRVLIYTGSRMPLSSLNRAIKYIKRGYHICDENLIAIAEDIARTVDFDDEESVQEHIAGMDPNGDRRIRVID